jgi:hypothetical protein
MDALNKVVGDAKVAAADAVHAGEAGASSWLSRPVPRWWLGMAVAAALVAGWLL